jgi:hypothetical protein
VSSALLSQIEPLNFAVVRLEPLFNDMKLGDATGFFVFGNLDNRPNFWLVTNWHVLSGRNADDPMCILHSQLALPNRLRLSLMLKPDQSEYESRPGQVLFQEQVVELYDADGRAMWYQHPQRNDRDVAVLNYAPHFQRFNISGVNELAAQGDMAIQIGGTVFILGYPLGFSHFANTPIWKKGSIASEPNLETPDSKTRVVIDATTRQGMSGAPVIMRERTHYLAEDGQIKTHVNATRWIGVYASRPVIRVRASALDEDRRAEVGYFYKMGCVYEAITHGIRGPDFGDPP